VIRIQRVTFEDFEAAWLRRVAPDIPALGHWQNPIPRRTESAGQLQCKCPLSAIMRVALLHYAAFAAARVSPSITPRLSDSLRISRSSPLMTTSVPAPATQTFGINTIVIIMLTASAGSKESNMRHALLTVSLAGALASGPLVLNLDRAEAMIAATGLGRGSETLSLIEKVGDMTGMAGDGIRGVAGEARAVGDMAGMAGDGIRGVAGAGTVAGVGITVGTVAGAGITGPRSLSGGARFRMDGPGPARVPSQTRRRVS
jgi:hypothetical protein